MRPPCRYAPVHVTSGRAWSRHQPGSHCTYPAALVEASSCPTAASAPCCVILDDGVATYSLQLPLFMKHLFSLLHAVLQRAGLGKASKGQGWEAAGTLCTEFLFTFCYKRYEHSYPGKKEGTQNPRFGCRWKLALQADSFADTKHTALPCCTEPRFLIKAWTG